MIRFYLYQFIKQINSTKVITCVSWISFQVGGYPGGGRYRTAKVPWSTSTSPTNWETLSQDSMTRKVRWVTSRGGLGYIHNIHSRADPDSNLYAAVLGISRSVLISRPVSRSAIYDLEGVGLDLGASDLGIFSQD